MRYTLLRCMPVRCTPMRYPPMRCTPVRHPPMRYTPMRHPPMRFTPMRYRLMRYTSMRHTHQMHACSVLRPLFRTLRGLLRYQRSSACFYLSVYHFSVHLLVISWPIRLPALFPLPRSPPFVDSLDSELWYRFECKAAALASSSTLAAG